MNEKPENMANIIPQPKEDTVVQEPQLDPEIEATGLHKESLPLYEFLKKQSPALDWNQNYEITLSGSLVPDSNIFTLIKDATKPNAQSVQSNDAVWRVFKKWLIDNNVPPDMVNNLVKKQEQLPEIQNPVTPSNFPTIQSMKRKYLKDGPAVRVDIQDDAPQSEETSIDDSENKQKKAKIRNIACQEKYASKA